MESLDSHYVELLHLGLVQVKHALGTSDHAWAAAQVELLHNIPSLIGENNVERHRYFWESERPHYLAWLARSGSPEAKAKTAVYYQAIWKEMEPLFASILRPAAATSQS